MKHNLLNFCIITPSSKIGSKFLRHTEKVSWHIMKAVPRKFEKIDTWNWFELLTGVDEKEFLINKG